MQNPSHPHAEAPEDPAFISCMAKLHVRVPAAGWLRDEKLLDARGKAFDLPECAALGRALRASPLEHLNVLSLSGAFVHGGAVLRDESGAHAGAAVLAAAAKAGALPALEALLFDKNRLEDAEGQELIRALDTCPRLIRLNLSGNHLGDGVAKLLGAGTLPLEQLHLDNNQVGDEGIVALSRVKLQRLFVQNNPFGDEGLRAIASSVASADGALHKACALHALCACCVVTLMC